MVDVNMSLLAATEVIEFRRNICNSCEYKSKRIVGICTKCGCFIVSKTSISSSTCPENKWTKLEKTNV